MRTHIMAGALLLLLSFFILSAPTAVAFASGGGSRQSINSSINSTTAYIQQVNESAYLIFYPNLSSAYNYLQKAENVSGTNATMAYVLLSEARASAAKQQDYLNGEKQVSAAVMAALTIITALLLFQVMKRRTPARKATTKR